MISEIVAGLGMGASAVGGGLFGLLGAIVSNTINALNRRSERKHELAMREMDMLELRAEWDYRERVAESEAQGAAATADAQMISSSYQHDTDLDRSLEFVSGRWRDSAWFFLPYMLMWLLRSGVRPVVTYGLLGYLLFFFAPALISSLNAAGADVVKMMDMLFLLQNSLIAIASSALAWWFGSRGTPTNSRK